MEMRKFILDLQPDGSVKWAEVSECNIEANEKAKRLYSHFLDMMNRATNELEKTYLEGYLDGISATMNLY